ncbi:Fic family protein [Aquimarina algiphila]|uniref:Fic family protein n=1 Tax=Aquimarina algiphila TaxID=2047982 RepID=A0A554VHK8_9FLAO|nr:Fic family protein [Aquimarina algiphila]TSE06979.1 Fic family protein [Aquimarina algiphila]
MSWKPSNLPYDKDPETKRVLKNLSAAHRALAELKGVAQSIPRQEILINTLTFQEAKDSSEVENIVTTHDELYKSSLGFEGFISPAAKEVENYSQALKRGFAIVSHKKILSSNSIIEIQETLERNNAGFRKLPGTNLKNQKTGEIVYEPPQSADEIKKLMQNLVEFINDNELVDYDPIVKMAIIHFQFESIHPFYDGNGRTGRIINILYLVLQELLDIPILYLSRYIIQHKGDYYRLLQEVRDHDNWELWILFMIKAVEETALYTIDIINDIKRDMMRMKNILRDNYKFYSQELLNHLFKLPYTKIEFLMEDLKISRVTASNYLNKLANDAIVHKHKLGKSNYYINPLLMDTLIKKK